jgi:hypothetical protein
MGQRIKCPIEKKNCPRILCLGYLLSFLHFYALGISTFGESVWSHFLAWVLSVLLKLHFIIFLPNKSTKTLKAIDMFFN